MCGSGKKAPTLVKEHPGPLGKMSFKCGWEAFLQTELRIPGQHRACSTVIVLFAACGKGREVGKGAPTPAPYNATLQRNAPQVGNLHGNVEHVYIHMTQGHMTHWLSSFLATCSIPTLHCQQAPLLAPGEGHASMLLWTNCSWASSSSLLLVFSSFSMDCLSVRSCSSWPWASLALGLGSRTSLRGMGGCWSGLGLGSVTRYVTAM